MNTSSPTLRTTMETQRSAIRGAVGLLLCLIVGAGAAGLLWLGVQGGPGAGWLVFGGVVLAGMALAGLSGMFILEPNQGMVLLLFGRYKGTVKTDGWHWVNPFLRKNKISLRANNFQSDRLKVNDADGNPIEIAAVVVWRVVDTARATFDVQNYAAFVQVQTETAIRHLSTKYPYDHRGDPDEETLRGNPDEVAGALQVELQGRLKIAGIEVMEARLSHLAYSAEIAAAMLQRQQAAAIIAARQSIVTGAAGIVESVLKILKDRRIVELTGTQKAELVSNLLVVLASEKGAQPILQVQ